MDLAAALDHARHGNAVLVTLKRDGRPQLSNVGAWVDGDRIRLSITGTRAKAANMRRDPRVSLYVGRPDHSGYVVVDGTAALSPEATSPDDATVDALVDYYRALRGEHPDWAEYRAAMIADRRIAVTITPEHAYGMWM